MSIRIRAVFSALLSVLPSEFYNAIRAKKNHNDGAVRYRINVSRYTTVATHIGRTDGQTDRHTKMLYEDRASHASIH